ncbi:uncharacterized protein LOC120921621 [Rana temporaria]|uniref:uncharacterized protein LOC120921621 n=1 Tax=Rana temporaria TaxID=8407 RepID=UPI001AAC4F86|nr:uncharacterized protein LOC120921621 [Rana temporaria]
MRAPFTMRSQTALLLLCVLIKASSADSQDLYAAVGEKMVIPLETRQDSTSGHFCNKYIWRYRPSADQYLQHIAGVSDICQKTDCKRSDCSLSSNGSLILHRVTHRDSGLYTIITYHLNNNRNTEKQYQLHVLDVVSDPVVKLQCLSNVSLLVTCAVEKGTKPQILLTINREEFGESEMGLINVTTSSPPPWNISCSANNKASQKMTNVFPKSCQDALLDPGLEFSCHVNGSVTISCVVESGADALYSWTVGGQPLQSDTNSSWQVRGNHITGDANSPRNVSCLARNVFDQVWTPQQVVHCPDPEKKLGVAKLCVKVVLCVMYNSLLVHSLWEIRKIRKANQ